MTGRGKGGAFGGAGKGTAVPNSSGTRGVGARRYRKIVRDSIHGITKNDIKSMETMSCTTTSSSTPALVKPATTIVCQEPQLTPTPRRLARRGGVKRISAMIYDDTREAMKAHLQLILKDCVIFLEHANRKTVTVGDVIFALKRIGRPIYGFGNGYMQSDAPNRKKRKD
ncbi:hypothetical protein V491_06961 [Pseudogymnoascus sp. VKM F-3775]|nr:hypothetical protein V491_06961 [Pseudogymnoascus sp. VKM F-3775]